MLRVLKRSPARDVVYYGLLASLSIALTHVFYLQINGLM